MSTIKVDNLQTTGGAGLYPAKAWVNFNGTGTVAVRGDGNVSSITDNATGKYTVNFSDSLTDANFSVTGLPGQNSTAESMHSMEIVSTTTSTAYLNVLAESNGAKAFRDTPVVTSTITR